MKILTKKKQDEILKMLSANHIIVNHSTMDTEHYCKFIENTADLAFLVGGIEGMLKVQNTVKNWHKAGEQHEID